MFGRKDLKKEIQQLKEQINDIEFEFLSKLFKLAKEASLLSDMADQLCGGSYEKLKERLLQPALEAKWLKDKSDKGQMILNKGVKIIEQRAKLYDDMLIAQKQNRERDYETMKIQLGVYDSILKEIEDENT